MAINKKLITFKEKSVFLEKIKESTEADANGLFGEVPAYSIVFIKDTCEIWHNGVYFGNNLDDSITGDSGIVCKIDSGSYTAKTFKLWGNELTASTESLTGALIVSYDRNQWVYDGTGIKYRYLTNLGNVSSTTEVLTYTNGSALSTPLALVVNNDLTANILKDTKVYYSTNNDIAYSSSTFYDSSGAFNATNSILNFRINSSLTNWESVLAVNTYSNAQTWCLGVDNNNFYLNQIGCKDPYLAHSWKFANDTGYLECAGFKIPNADANAFLKADGTYGTFNTWDLEINLAAPLSIGTEWTDLADSVNTTIKSSLKDGGVYIIGINYHNTKYSGIFTYSNTTMGDEEIILHCCSSPSESSHASQGRVFARIACGDDYGAFAKTTKLQVALSKADTSITTFNIKFKLFAIL